MGPVGNLTETGRVDVVPRLHFGSIARLGIARLQGLPFIKLCHLSHFAVVAFIRKINHPLSFSLNKFEVLLSPTLIEKSIIEKSPASTVKTMPPRVGMNTPTLDHAD